MTNTLTQHMFHTAAIRVVEIDGQPWFAAKDICEALEIKNHRHALGTNVHAVNKMTVYKSNVVSGDISLPNRGMTFVSKSGAYELVMQSRKPAALDFKFWITNTVIPALEKDGAYFVGEEKVATGEMHEDELVLKAMGILQKKVERLTAELCCLRHPAHLQPR